MARLISKIFISVMLLSSVVMATQVTSIVLCEEISEADEVPIGVAEMFNADVPQIQGIVTVGDCPAGTKVKGAWICVDGIDVPNYEIDAAEAVFQEAGGGLAYFSLSRPDNGWPTGNYKLDVYINDQPTQSAPFSISAAATEPITETVPEIDATTSEKLQALDAAYQAGILSEAEYNQKKAELLNQTNINTPAPSLPSGQIYQSPLGISFWCPPGWTVKEINQKIELLPANKLSFGTIAAEKYYIYGVQAGVQPIGDGYVRQYIEPQLKILSPLLASTGSPTQINNGNALVYNWETNILEDLQIKLAARAYINTSSNKTTILVGFGSKPMLDARDGELRQILNSAGSGNTQPAPPNSMMSNPTLQSSGFNGTYTLTNQNTTLTLTMNQNTQGVISGNLSSTTGAQYQLNGQVEDGIAVGMCTSAEGAVYFEGQLQGNQLLFNMIEIGVNNMPDYNNARQLIFIKNQTTYTQPPQPTPQPTYPQQGTSQPAQATSTMLGDPGWGFSFAAPQGWQGQKTPQSIVLTNSSIVGSIVVFPHTDTSLQQVHMNMQQGLVEEGVQLAPVTQVANMGNNAVAADYGGIVNGTQMKARGIGTFNPNGGGAYIIALASPEQYSQQLANAANSIAANMQYSQPQTSSTLVQHFAGQWWRYNEGATLTAYLSPDGRFSDTYEYTAHVENRDQYGDVSSTATILSNEQTTGRWSVRGDTNRGVLIITYDDGTQDTMNYQVHVENGQAFYNEYLFDGQLWNKGPLP